MTYREVLVKHCNNRGMSKEDAESIVSNLIAIHGESSPMTSIWDQEETDQILLDTLLVQLRDQAVRYIEKNTPKAWYKELFQNTSKI